MGYRPKSTRWLKRRCAEADSFHGAEIAAAVAETQALFALPGVLAAFWAIDQCRTAVPVIAGMVLALRGDGLHVKVRHDERFRGLWYIVAER